ncbi:hypothetical protein EDD85DRAFT_931961 [Armillaria nabsnona]|nr:hypothetical protein EDD85DRAFT_931961 [Armillaria nabsnona]
MRRHRHCQALCCAALYGGTPDDLQTAKKVEDDGLAADDAQLEGEFAGEGGDGRAVNVEALWESSLNPKIGTESSMRQAAGGLYGTPCPWRNIIFFGDVEDYFVVNEIRGERHCFNVPERSHEQGQGLGDAQHLDYSIKLSSLHEKEGPTVWLC